jgi:C1A family cysteine protease
MRFPRLLVPGVAVLLLAVVAGGVSPQKKPGPMSAQQPTQARQNYRPAPRSQMIFHSRGSTPQVDLRPEIARLALAIRDQGNRGTCSVFATTFLIEYHEARTRNQNGLQLSEEYLNWAKNAANKTDFDGGMFTDIIAGYQGYGMVPSTDMPYKPVFHPKEKPSKSVIATGKSFDHFPVTFIKNWDHDHGMTAAELEKTKNQLRHGHPVATGIWWLANVETVTVDGVPLLKEYPRKANTGSNPPMFDGHSIDLVGFHEGSQFPGGGYFIFRNSMGTGWGDGGYGYLSFQYVRDYSNDAIAIEQKE